MHKKYIFVLSTLEGGGAELSTVLLANEISKSRSVEIVCGNRVSNAIRCMIKPSVTFTRMKAERFSRNMVELRTILSSYCEEHCVVSVCSHVSIITYIVHKTTRNKALRTLIFSERAVFDVNTPRTIKGILVRGIARFVYKKPNYIHAISVQVAESIERLCPESAKIFVVANICERARGRKHESHGSGTVLRLASMNRLSKDKHVEEQLLALFYALDSNAETEYSMSLDIYGDGVERERLEHLANTLGLSKLVNFKGYVCNSEIAWDEIDVVISTSSHEGFGRTVFESLVNTKYLIAYNYLGIPEEEPLSYILPFGHTHILTREIKNALRRKLEGLPMVTEREAFVERYSADTVTNRFLKYCEDEDLTSP